MGAGNGNDEGGTMGPTTGSRGIDPTTGSGGINPTTGSVGINPTTGSKGNIGAEELAAKLDLADLVLVAGAPGPDEAFAVKSISASG